MDLIGVREAAEALCVHEQTVRNWIRKGYLRAYRVNPRGKLFLRTDDLKKTMGEFEDEDN